jgi:hypothetical protein
MCSYDGERIFFHDWVGKKKTTNGKRVRFLEELMPHLKLDELEVLSVISTDKEIKDLARQHGYDEATIAKKIK